MHPPPLLVSDPVVIDIKDVPVQGISLEKGGAVLEGFEQRACSG